MKTAHLAAVLLVGALVGLAISSGLSVQDRAGCTAVVQPGDSIQAAIDAAEEGAVICLTQGTWEERIEIEKSLTLQGEDMEHTVIAGALEDHPLVRIATSEGGSVSLRELTITGADGECTDPDGGVCAAGVLVHGAARAEITGCIISENRIGILLGDSTEAEIARSTISRNRADGILLEDAARAEIVENTIENNGGCGISSRTTGKVQGGGNGMSGNGADLCGNLPGELRTPSTPLLTSAALVITISPQGPSIQEAVDALPPGGTLVLRSGEYEAGVTIARDLRLEAEEGARVVLRGRSTYAPAISLVSGGKVELKGLEVTGGLHGILLAADAQAKIVDCTVSSAKAGEGVLLWNTARAEITHSTISGNGSSGISLMHSAQLMLAASTVAENGLVGILLYDGAQAEISDSMISGNRYGGIELWDSTQAIIADSTVSGSIEDGILLGSAAQATIDGNLISDNERYGVALYLQSCGFPYGERAFRGRVSGKGNTIPGPEELDGNHEDAVCPEELKFLASEEGGAYP